MNSQKAGPHFNRKLLSLAIGTLLATAAASALAQEAVDAEKLFKEGVYQREQGNLFTSIEALETVLSAQPALNRARLELAVSYYRTLNFEAARKQSQVVLNDPKTPENVRLAVRAFLAQIEKDEQAALAQRHRWEPSVSLGLMHDSNVNVGPSSDVLPGGFVLTPGSLPRSDTAAVLQAGITHQYNSPTVLRVGESAARFLWQSRANLYHRAYFSERDFNLTALTLATGPGFQAPNKWRANVNFQIDDLYLGSDNLALYTSVAPSVTWQLKNAELTWDAVYLDKNFKRELDTGRDSAYQATGVSYGHLFQQGKVAVQGGVRVFDEKVKSSDPLHQRYGNDGWEAFLGANFVAWQNGSVYGRINHKEAKYDGVEPLFAVSRDEKEERYEIGFAHNFKEGGLANWKLGGSVQRTENRSNVSIYTYDRDVASVNLSRSF